MACCWTKDWKSPCFISGNKCCQLQSECYNKSYSHWSVRFLKHSRDFPKIDHSGSSTLIVLEKNKFSKKVTSYGDWIRNPRTVALASCVYSLSLPNCAYSHCFKDWDFKDPCIVMLYWFQLIPLSSKSIWRTNKSWVKDPSVNTCQVGKAWNCKHKKWAL